MKRVFIALKVTGPLLLLYVNTQREKAKAVFIFNEISGARGEVAVCAVVLHGGNPCTGGGLASLLRVTLFGWRGFLCLPPSIAPLPHLSNFEACCAVGVMGSVGGRVAVLSVPAAV